MGPNVQDLTVGLEGEDLRVVQACFVSRGKNKGLLKSAKPFPSTQCRRGSENAEFKGAVNYVWRMLCFDFLSYAPHSCIPVSADWDYHMAVKTARYGEAGYTESEENFKRGRDLLDALIKRAESNLPVTLQSGAMRWASVFGII